MTVAPAPAGDAGRNWIAVASAEHVRIGRAAGFMQVCHGKATPLRRIHAGDRVAYYSPTVAFRGRDSLQSFTAIGVVAAREPYRHEGAASGPDTGLRPFRRDVTWLAAIETPIRPLLPRLAFARHTPNWGYQLRFGLFAISAADMDVIAAAMGVEEGAPQLPARPDFTGRIEPISFDGMGDRR